MFDAQLLSINLSPRVTVDTETTGLEPHTGDRLCGVAVRYPIIDRNLYREGVTVPLFDEDGNMAMMEAYFPFRHKPGYTLFDQSDNLPIAWLPELLRALNKPHGSLRFHHAKFDLTMMAYEGFDFHNNPFECTQIMSWLNNESESHRLKDLHDKYIPNSKSKEREALIKDYVHKEGSYAEVAPQAMEPYACGDVIDTDDIYEFLLPKLRQQELMKVLELEYNFARLLFELEFYGIGLDLPHCSALAGRVAARLTELRQELNFDPMRPSELARNLFSMPPEGLGLPLPSTLTKTPSAQFPQGIPEMRRDWLAQHAHHSLVASVLEYRSLVKAGSTWFQGFLDHADSTSDGRIHTTFNGTGRGKSKMGIEGKTGTVTGRLNSSNPNIQQIPRQDDPTDASLQRQVKTVFTPGRQRWGLFELDYSQIETRIAAGYADADLMIEALRSGEDVHRVTANGIGCSRQTAKHATYTILYGGGAPTLARTIERLEFQTTGKIISYSIADAQDIINAYYNLYPGFRTMQQKCASLMRERKFLKLWDGRRRHYEQWFDPKLNKMVDNSHKAFNSLIQGGAANIIKHTMLMVPRKDHAYRMVSQVHDSLWFEVCDDFREDWLAEIEWWMTWPSRDKRFKVPFPVDIKFLKHEPFDVSKWNVA